MKNRLKQLGKYILDSDYRFFINTGLGVYNNVPDEEYIKKKYKIYFGKEPDLENPVGFNEKLQWLKLYDRKSKYTEFVDKLAVKKFVEQKIGGEYVVPIIGSWSSAEEIPWEELPDRFVLKCTHDSGGLIVCKDKEKLDRLAATKKLNKGLKRDYYLIHREWPYKNVERKIFAEQYIEDSKSRGLNDYKFFCFNGTAKVLYIAQGRNEDSPTVADFYDMNFQHLDLTIDHDMAMTEPEKPQNFELMKELAEILSEGIPHVRVDFYEVDGRVYFGEMTFFHCSGFAAFHPEKWDKVFGDWIELPEKTESV